MSDKLNTTNVEEMLEYIEQLEAQLDEYSTVDKSAVDKSKKHFDKDSQATINKASYGYGKHSKADAISQYPSSARLKPKSKISFADAFYNAHGGEATHVKASQKSRTQAAILRGESIEEMIDSLMSGKLTESNSLFYDLLNYKITEGLEERKIAVAKALFGIQEEKEDDDDEDDKEADKHPLIQLKKIASSEDDIPTKYPEVTASGEADKRSVKAAEERKASGKSTSGIPKFKHANGEESEVHPTHAQHLVNVLSGSGLKPETKKQVMDHIHGSKAGLEKVSHVLIGKHPKEKSIYGSDARD